MSIASAKSDLAAAIRTAVGPRPTVKAYLPTQINTRAAVVIAPADNYVLPGETFGGDVKVTVDAYALVTVTTNKADDAALDDLIGRAFPALSTWDVEGVERPDIYKFGEWAMYGIRFILSTTTPLGA